MFVFGATNETINVVALNMFGHCLSSLESFIAAIIIPTLTLRVMLHDLDSSESM